MSPTLWRASLRDVRRHAGLTALAILGVALGVAVVVAIDLAAVNARRAFTLSTEAVTGRATHQVQGGPTGLDEAVYWRLRTELGIRAAAPVVEGWVALAEAPGRAFRLLGVDPLAEGPFRPHLARTPDPAGERGEPEAGQSGLRTLRALLTEPGTLLLSADTARELSLTPGRPLTLLVAGRRHPARLAGWLAPADLSSGQALEGLAVTDIASAQEALGSRGRLARIDLVVPPGPEGAALLDAVRTALPPGATVETAAARGVFVDQITRAFQVNLAALSLLALVVGAFLVHGTMSFAVVRRRAAIGLWRALGVTRGEVLALLLLEGLVVGAVATGTGLLLGTALARGLVRLVTRTINDLYFVVAVRDLALPPAVLLESAALGLGATLAAVVAPVLEATGVPPGAALSRAALEARVAGALPLVALGGLGLLGLGVAVLAGSGASLPWSHAGLFLVVLGGALLAPAATAALARGARPLLGGLLGTMGRLVAGGLVASLSRTAVAVAALMVALATAVGIGLMVASFRATVGQWLSTSLVADVYVSAPGPVGGRAEGTLDPETVARLRRAPGVGAAGSYRGVRVGSARGPTHLVALDIPSASHRQFRFLAGRPEAVWPAFHAGGAAIVSEPYAYRQGIRVGSSVRLRTERGERDFPVAGIFADYGSDQGVVMVSRRTYDRFWDDPGVTSLGVTAAPGADPDALVATLRRVAEQAPAGQNLLVRSNRALRASSLAIFDRTFAITGVLRLLALTVALIGVLSALLALQLERRREVAVLRAEGLTPRQVFGLMVGQTGLLGLIAGLLALPLGVAVAWILVHVINRRSFGWTLTLELSPGPLVETLVLAVVVAVLAGVYPALSLARTPPAVALRAE